MEIDDVLWDIKVTKVLAKYRKKGELYFPVVRHRNNTDAPVFLVILIEKNNVSCQVYIYILSYMDYVDFAL